MAEAHSAVAFSFSITHEGVNIDYNREVLSLVWKSGLRSWKKKFYRFVNNVRNGYYPQSASSLWLLLSFLTGVQVSSAWDPSLGYISWLSTWMPGHSLHPLLPKTLSTFIFGSTLWLGCMMMRKYSLKSLFMYKGWMFERRGAKASISTRIWVSAVKLLEGSHPLLYSYQSCLPSLPLPSVDETMTRYLTSVRPLVDDQQFARLEKLAEEFRISIGPKLQRYLRLKSWWATNYVSDWWEEFVYLRGRDPLMVNSNFYALDPLEITMTTNQAARAANLIYASFLFRRTIDLQQLKPILLQGLIPLCSWQYERLFNTTRVPGTETDRLDHFADSTHVAVYHGGKYFKLQTHFKGRLLTPAEIQVQLEKIMADNNAPAAGEECLAALTASERVTWAETRANCFRRGVNRVALDAIERSAFMVILDDESYSYDSKDTSKLDHYARSMLHGKGYDRWFDKSFNLIIGRNGKAGFNAEHSWADAPIMGHYWEFVLYHDHHHLKYDNMGNTTGYKNLSVKNTMSFCGDLPQPIKLKFDMSQECVSLISECALNAHKLLQDLDLHLLRHSDFGKRLIKKCRVSPDAFLQMALQLAYFRDMGKFSLSYEASMTRLYREGRTETVRPVTLKSCEFVHSMMNVGSSKQHKRNALIAACEQHQNGYQDAMCGRGIDRHLFCLYVVSKYLELDSPFLKEVLSEPWRLSTSQTPCNQTGLLDFSQNPEFISAGGGFGPVANDGYGVSYLIAGEDNFFFHVSSKKSSPETDSTRFAGNIAQALHDMKDIFSD